MGLPGCRMHVSSPTLFSKEHLVTMHDCGFYISNDHANNATPFNIFRVEDGQGLNVFKLEVA